MSDTDLTVEELNTFPVGQEILDQHDDVWVKRTDDLWVTTLDDVEPVMTRTAAHLLTTPWRPFRLPDGQEAPLPALDRQALLADLLGVLNIEAGDLTVHRYELQGVIARHFPEAGRS